MRDPSNLEFNSNIDNLLDSLTIDSTDLTHNQNLYMAITEKLLLSSQ